MYQEINILPKASASSKESGHMGGGGGIIWKWRKIYFKVNKQKLKSGHPFYIENAGY